MSTQNGIGARSEVFSSSQYGGAMRSSHEGRPTRINFFILPIFILEVIGLACLWALFYYLRFTTVFPYHHRVFRCSDESLSLPNYKPEDFNLFVSEQTLYCVSFIIPPVVILVGEIMFWIFSTKPRKTSLVTCQECKVHLFTRRLFRFFATFIFGALIVCIFIDSIKLMTGYQRPYFLTLCNATQRCPRLNDFSPWPSPAIICRSRLEAELRYAWLSFPSIYAGLSSFASVFASCYVHYMISLRGAPLLRPLLIFGFLGMALIASFSRIQGYKNHWRDIWWAWIIGGLTALYLCRNLLRFQEFYRIREEILPEQRISPFFSWFRLPRINTSKEPAYGVYPADDENGLFSSPGNSRQQKNNLENQRTYEVTTTTESFHRTVRPNGQQQAAATLQPGGHSAY